MTDPGKCCKRRFASRGHALAFQDRRFPTTYRRAYLCSCGWWHITTRTLADVFRAQVRGAKGGPPNHARP